MPGLRHNPISDGDLCGGCESYVDQSYLWVSPTHNAFVKFSNVAFGQTFDRAWLSVNFYQPLPQQRQLLRVLGFDSVSGQLQFNERFEGAEIAVQGLPASLAVGETVLFDVTDFVRETSAPFLVFRLQGGGGDLLLSSLEVNHGLPAQLILTAVPEPTGGPLMFAGLLSLAGWLRRRAALTPR